MKEPKNQIDRTKLMLWRMVVNSQYAHIEAIHFLNLASEIMAHIDLLYTNRFPNLGDHSLGAMDEDQIIFDTLEFFRQIEKRNETSNIDIV